MDGSGKIDYSEWVVATANKKSLLTKAKLKKAFDLFDKVLFLLNKYQDGSGSISALEIKEVLGQGKNITNDNIWDDIIKEVDANGDGEISLPEFETMMNRLLQQ